MGRHIRAEPYCTLCRCSLPIGTVCQRLGGQQLEAGEQSDWAFQFVCGFESRQLHSGEPVMITFCTDLRKPNWKSMIESECASMFGLAGKRKVYICFDFMVCTSCDLSDTLQFTHTQCFRLANTLPGYSATSFQRLVQRNRPLMSWYLSKPLNGMRSAPGFPDALATTTDLGALVERIRKRLPVELQAIIYGNVSGLFRFLAETSFTLTELNPEAGPYSRVANHPVPHSQVKRLGANCTNILGEECLTEIGSDNEMNFEQEIALQDKPVFGIQVSLGTFGVVAVRVIYQDTSMSPWLGFGHRKWTTTYRGDDLSKLHTISDGFKLIRVELASPMDGEASPPLHNSAQLFFDHDAVPHPKDRYMFADMKIPGGEILGNPDARLAQYIDLRRVEIQSFTVVCSIEAIFKIQINGGGSKLELGEHVAIKPSSTDEENFSITQFFRPRERIVSIHMITRGPERPMVWKGPFLLVRTSQSRTLYFGTFVLPFSRPIHLSSFETQDTNEITGLFMDPTSINPGKINTLGVCLGSRSNDDSPGNPGLSNPSAHQGSSSFIFPSVYPFAAFFSRATLLNVVAIEVQKFGDRCVGMCIKRESAIVETLGIWDPVRVDAIFTLYNCQQGPLESLTFIYSDSPEPMKRHVENILVSIPPSLIAERPTFTWKASTSQLAWWFTPRYVFLQSWQGADSSILDTLEPDIPCIYGR